MVMSLKRTGLLAGMLVVVSARESRYAQKLGVHGMELRRVFSFLSLLAILVAIIYFESMYLPFTTECYYVRGVVIYDTPCLALSTVLESLGLVVLSCFSRTGRPSL
jgi:hypothetical protein